MIYVGINQICARLHNNTSLINPTQAQWLIFWYMLNISSGLILVYAEYKVTPRDKSTYNEYIRKLDI